MTDVYYVYEHWRTDLKQCFYVGKGKSFRAYNMIDRSKKHRELLEKIFNDGFAVEIKIIATGLSEEKALQLEAEKIKFWKDSGADLINGSGSTGYKHTNWAKERISFFQKKRHRAA